MLDFCLVLYSLSYTWVSKTLGHSSIKVTAERYNRLIPNLTRQDGSAFEKVLSDSQIGNNKSFPGSQIGNNLVTPLIKSLK